ncbi:MAG: flagellar hook-length control protein FliK, partial [Pseudomonadota bacterium]
NRSCGCRAAGLAGYRQRMLNALFNSLSAATGAAPETDVQTLPPEPAGAFAEQLATAQVAAGTTGQVAGNQAADQPAGPAVPAADSDPELTAEEPALGSTPAALFPAATIPPASERPQAADPAARVPAAAIAEPVSMRGTEADPTAERAHRAQAAPDESRLIDPGRIDSYAAADTDTTEPAVDHDLRSTTVRPGSPQAERSSAPRVLAAEQAPVIDAALAVRSSAPTSSSGIMTETAAAIERAAVQTIATTTVDPQRRAALMSGQHAVPTLPGNASPAAEQATAAVPANAPATALPGGGRQEPEPQQIAPATVVPVGRSRGQVGAVPQQRQHVAVAASDRAPHSAADPDAGNTRSAQTLERSLEMLGARIATTAADSASRTPAAPVNDAQNALLQAAWRERLQPRAADLRADSPGSVESAPNRLSPSAAPGEPLLSLPRAAAAAPPAAVAERRMATEGLSGVRVQAEVGSTPAITDSVVEALRAERQESAADLGRFDLSRPAQAADRLVRTLYANADVPPGESPSRSLRLVLNPASLGEMDVQFARNDRGEVSIQITTTSGVTRDVLEPHLARVRANLEELGVRLGSLDVQVSQQDGRDARQQSDAREHPTPSTVASTPAALQSAESPQPQGEAPRPAVLNRLLDTFA